MSRRETIQCGLVAAAVRNLGCHATADEIYREIARAHPAISRATVYRNLQRLCEAGDIRKREIPGGADRYDHLSGDHYHASCVECGRVFDVDMDYMHDLTDLIRDQRGFTFTGHDIIFRGVCSECAERARGEII